MTSQPADETILQSDGGEERPDQEIDMQIDVALLALSEDVEGPTEEVDLNTLSPAEKRALLACLRERFELPAP